MTVFDASVIVKTLTEEPLSANAILSVASEPHAVAPDILTFEVASALSKKGRYFDLPREKIDDALAALPDMVSEQVASTFLLDKAMSLALELKHAFYDCLYLALAEDRDCDLVTADQKFAAVVTASRYAKRIRLLTE
ncbi:MAG: type II toxin-antitoxin system VapC family toxin [Sphingomonas sp.]|uniref:type II toxin-antitoxin system VapC family toxin n=1 Tax=Sphingomonas sp. TaxID=28214 RepID=UPI001AC66E41|nr:type II toxin-antitoxin system VapC family toxin [Sphingomonas sp.]MBN8807343.1 type II toxin-antitoxin system VapC family toxin [Sphingomonas sp.]